MASRKLEKRHLRELRRITDSIPKELLENLMTKTTIAPTLAHLLEKATTLDTVSEEDKDRYKALLNSGVLDREVDTVDFTVEKLIDEYVTAELALAVKMGRLPPEAPAADYMKRKGKKYARKNAERIKKLYQDTAERTETSAEGDDQQLSSSDSESGSDGNAVSEPHS